MIDLLLATDNPGKLAELRSLLPEDVRLAGLRGAGLEAPEETGSTFAANAALKAVEAARRSGLLTLADDSGLEVDALGVLASASGSCPGSIGPERRGKGGFGYDPIFVLQDGRTMAELTAEEKNRISHRGKALREIMPAVLIAIAAQRLHLQGVGQ